MKPSIGLDSVLPQLHKLGLILMLVGALLAFSWLTADRAVGIWEVRSLHAFGLSMVCLIGAVAIVWWRHRVEVPMGDTAISALIEMTSLGLMQLWLVGLYLWIVSWNWLIAEFAVAIAAGVLAVWWVTTERFSLRLEQMKLSTLDYRSGAIEKGEYFRQMSPGAEIASYRHENYSVPLAGVAFGIVLFDKSGTFIRLVHCVLLAGVVALLVCCRPQLRMMSRIAKESQQ